MPDVTRGCCQERHKKSGWGHLAEPYTPPDGSATHPNGGAASATGLAGAPGPQVAFLRCVHRGWAVTRWSVRSAL